MFQTVELWLNQLCGKPYMSNFLSSELQGLCHLLGSGPCYIIKAISIAQYPFSVSGETEREHMEYKQNFFLTSLLEYNCFTMLCQFLLYNKVNQLYVYIYPHIPSLLHLPPTLPIPALQVDTKHLADLPVLCSCFPLAIYLTFGSKIDSYYFTSSQ